MTLPAHSSAPATRMPPHGTRVLRRVTASGGLSGGRFYARGSHASLPAPAGLGERTAYTARQSPSLTDAAEPEATARLAPQVAAVVP
jgi:hypothetical protein